jgi:hypothetical protein
MTQPSNPFLTTAAALPAAKPLATWSVTEGEELIYEDSALHCWLTADNLVDGAGNYADRGPRGFNGLQATPALQPPIFNNATTGRNAWTFDGVSGCLIVLNALLPPSPLTIVSVCDIDPGVATGDNMEHAIAGSTLSSATAQRYGLEMLNRGFRVFNRNGASTTTAAHPVSTPQLVIGIFDPANQTYGVRVNGTSTLMAAQSVNNVVANADVTMSIGSANIRLAAAASQYKGHIYEVLVFNGALTDPVAAARLAVIEATLKAKHGIVAPSREADTAEPQAARKKGTR